MKNLTTKTTKIEETNECDKTHESCRNGKADIIPCKYRDVCYYEPRIGKEDQTVIGTCQSSPEGVHCYRKVHHSMIQMPLREQRSLRRFYQERRDNLYIWLA